MKQKPVFLKHLTYIVSIASLLIPAANVFHLNKLMNFNEGNHPKNVTLIIPDAITCLPPVNYSVGANCMAHVVDTVPKSNVTIVSLSYSIDGGPTVPLSSPFPTILDLGMRAIDTFSVVWNVEDSEGAIAVCTHIKRIRDTTSPSITCPLNVTVSNDQNGRLISARMPFYSVDFGPPVFSDNCSPKDSITLVNDYTFNKDTIADFPLGTTTVCWRVTDKNGNSNSCCHTITVRDSVPPVITCPDTIKTQCSVPSPYSTFAQFRTAGGSATDDVRLDSMSFRFIQDERVDSTCVNRKRFHRYYTIRDTSGNADTCFQVIVVRDTTPPNIVCKDSINLYMNSSGMVSIAVTSLLTSVSDNCMGTVNLSTIPENLTFDCDDLINNKIINVTLTAKDTCGNTSICNPVLLLRDTIKPTITCPINITVSTAAGRCDTLITYPEPTAIDNCGPITPFRISGQASGTRFLPGLHTITYRATDMVGRFSECSFTITVKDMVNPIINCPAIDSVSLNDSCYIIVPDLSTKVIFGDNCGPTTLTQVPVPGTVIPTKSDSVHQFVFTVTDTSGLTAVCTTLVTAKDNLGPDIVCVPKRQVSLSGSTTSLSAQSFVISAKDNCEGSLTYQARRMGTICGSNVMDDFGPTIDLCCDDVNDTIIMVIRVSDVRGNFTECMDTVIVSDGVTPQIMEFLPDVTISCEYPLNISDLSVFGTYQHQDSTPLTNVIMDPPRPTFTFQNGRFTENCPGTTLITSTINGLNMCNQGEIKRVFAIRDAGGNIVRDTQSIFVMDFNKFGMSDITWPPSPVNYYDCQRAVPDTTITKSPGIRNDRCSQAGATFVDEPFVHPSHCKAILRKWTVLDWCQYQTNTTNSPGKFTFDQLILIKDTIAPEITWLNRDTFCTYNDCNLTATFGVSATDNCTLSNNLTYTYKIDLGSNGTTDLTGSGSTLTRNFPLGVHRFTWEVKDPCGNTKSSSLYVTFKDCKAPSLVVMKGLAASLMPVLNMVQIKAKLFNNSSSDNCTPVSQLRFSYSSNPNDTIRTFTCDSIGTRTVTIYLTDNYGNQTKSTTTIDIQDTHGTCGPSVLLNVNGTVYTENKAVVPDIKIKIDGGETERETTTDKNGNYSFNNLAKLNDYEIIPEKNTGHLEGISTLDLVMIQRHILGLKKLESPYKLIAADVNNSNSITAADLVELRKLVLGVQNEFSNNTSWRFIDAAYSFNDLNQPWLFKSNLQYSNLDQNMVKSDFIGVKVGDVNDSVMDKLMQTSSRNSNKVLLNIEELKVNAGETVVVPVYAGNAHMLAGAQWTMELKQGLTFNGIESGTLVATEENVAIIQKNGKQYVTLSSHQINEKSDQSSEIFKLIFTATKNGTLSSMLSFTGDITSASVVTQDMEEKQAGFIFRTKVPEETYILQNQPNPFRGETTIQLSLKKQTMTEISIFDAKGSSIYHGFENLQTGIQTITVGDKQLGNQTGVFYCKIKTNEMSKVIKMLRIE